MNNPLVSIIIPTFNRAHLIGETLDSVLAQTYENWECIIVDDGSTDSSNTIIEKYVIKDSRFQYHHRPKDKIKGANACRNYGLDIVKGSYILFFDSDDILNINILKSSINLLITGVDFVFYNYAIFTVNTKNIIMTQYNNTLNPFIDYFSGKINLATPSIVWRYDVVKNIRFDEKLKKTQETNFIFKVYKNFKKRPLIGRYINEQGFLVRKHNDSIVNSFHQEIPIFLLSDIKVRQQIIDYFKVTKFQNICDYNKELMEQSLRLYFYNANFLEFFVIIMKFDSKNQQILVLKIKMFLFKIIYSFTKRNYRFNLLINKLFGLEYSLKNMS